MQGPANTDALLALPDCQVVAACDLDTKHLEQAVNKINDHYGKPGLPARIMITAR